VLFLPRNPLRAEPYPLEDYQIVEEA